MGSPPKINLVIFIIFHLSLPLTTQSLSAIPDNNLLKISGALVSSCLPLPAAIGWSIRVAAHPIFVMTTNELSIRAAHALLQEAASIHAAHIITPHDLCLLELGHRDLLRKFLIEKNAKNKAYEFILQSGLLDAFYEHCTGEKPNQLSSPEN